MAKRGFACRVQVTGRTTRICPKRRVSHASAGGEAGDFKKLFTIEERSGRGRGGSGGGPAHKECAAARSMPRPD